jgi:hypothetical protein
MRRRALLAANAHSLRNTQLANRLADLVNYDAGRTIQFGQAGQKQRTLADLGQRAAAGDYKGAEAAAWRGGEPDIAAHIHGMAVEDQQRLVEDTARFALGASTPEQWEAGRQEWEARGYSLPPFAARNVVISQAIQAADQFRMRQDQANADRTYALQERTAARADAATAAKPPDTEEFYDETTGLPYKAVWNPSARTYERVGGTKAPSGTSLQVDPTTGAVTFQQGSALKLTEGQSKDSVFITRATGALPLIDKYGDALTDLTESVAGRTPIVGNYAKSQEFQQAEQAGKEFLQAILRKDTGAAITKEETAEYGSVYLPQPGDSAAVLAQKKEARGRAVRAIASGLPPAQILQAERASGQTVPPPPPTASPGRDEIEQEMRRRGLIKWPTSAPSRTPSSPRSIAAAPRLPCRRARRQLATSAMMT